LLPANPSSTYFDETREYLERGAGEFSAALSRTLSDYLTMVDVDLDVDVVLASEPGSYYSSQASIRDRLLVSLLFYSPFAEDAVDAEGAGQWWAELADVVAHELYHLHSYLLDTERERANERRPPTYLGPAQ